MFEFGRKFLGCFGRGLFGPRKNSRLRTLRNVKADESEPGFMLISEEKSWKVNLDTFANVFRYLEIWMQILAKKLMKHTKIPRDLLFAEMCDCLRFSNGCGFSKVGRSAQKNAIFPVRNILKIQTFLFTFDTMLCLLLV